MVGAQRVDGDEEHVGPPARGRSRRGAADAGSAGEREHGHERGGIIASIMDEETNEAAPEAERPPGPRTRRARATRSESRAPKRKMRGLRISWICAVARGADLTVALEHGAAVEQVEALGAQRHAGRPELDRLGQTQVEVPDVVVAHGVDLGRREHVERAVAAGGDADELRLDLALRARRRRPDSSSVPRQLDERVRVDLPRRRRVEGRPARAAGLRGHEVVASASCSRWASGCPVSARTRPSSTRPGRGRRSPG